MLSLSFSQAFDLDCDEKPKFDHFTAIFYIFRQNQECGIVRGLIVSFLII